MMIGVDQGQDMVQANFVEDGNVVQMAVTTGQSTQMQFAELNEDNVVSSDQESDDEVQFKTNEQSDNMIEFRTGVSELSEGEIDEDLYQQGNDSALQRNQKEKTRLEKIERKARIKKIDQENEAKNC